MQEMKRPAARQAVMTQVLAPEWAEASLLPRLSSLAQTRSDVRRTAGWLLDPGEYRTSTDHVVAAFVPELRYHVAAFYAGCGAPARVLLDAEALVRIDRQLANAIPSVCQRWRTFKDEAERRGASTRQAADLFARSLPPLLASAAEPPVEPDLDPVKPPPPRTARRLTPRPRSREGRRAR
jgi:hypothetical protein